MLRALILLAALLAATTCAAHTVGVSRGTYRVDDSSLEAELVFARDELALVAPALAADRGALETALVAGVDVSAAGRRCAGTLADARLVTEDGLAVVLRFDCPGTPSTLHFTLIDTLSLGHRHLARVGGADAELVVLHTRAADIVLQATADAPRGTLALVGLGVEHILTGYDHLLFLLGLVVVGGTWRQWLVVVTSFTVAHSMTLGLAALGIVAASPALVEPAIAATIVWVGVENMLLGSRLKPLLRNSVPRRWVLTFPFGLVHGFGFAGVLQELAVPAGETPSALLAFNVGVELGQLLVLAPLLPALAALRRTAWFPRWGIRTFSAAIAVAGLAWFVERVA